MQVPARVENALAIISGTKVRMPEQSRTVSSVRCSTILHILGMLTLPHIALALTLTGVLEGGIFTYAQPVFGFIVIPILDAIIHPINRNDEVGTLPKEVRFVLNASPAVFLLAYFAILIIAFDRLSGFNWIELIGITISLGFCGTLLTAAAHELIHKKSTLERDFGELGYIAIGYWHFSPAHLLNHHPHVATDLDNHAPSVGTNLYQYIFTSYPKAVQFTKETLQKPAFKTRFLVGKYPALSVAGPLLIAIISFFLGGILGVVFYITVCLLSLLLAEAAFYLEHYGISRQPEQRVRDVHSWDSEHRFSSYLTFMVQLHAHHHLSSTARYYQLKSYPDSAKLVCGYPLLLLATLFPPLCSAILDNQAKIHLDQKINME